MNEDEITKLKLMICHLDLSVETKEKLYNQAHKIRNQLQQKENIIKEVREKLNTQLAFTSSYQLNYQSAMSIIEQAKQILDKGVDKK